MSKKIKIRLTEARVKRGPYKTPAEKSQTVRDADKRKRDRRFRDMALEPHKELSKLGRGITEDSLEAECDGDVGL